METRTPSPTDSDLLIVVTQTQCRLFKDYHQTFQSRVVEDGERLLANVTGTCYKNNIDYDQVNQISSHAPTGKGVVRLFGYHSWRARCNNAEREWDERLVKKSDGLHLELGFGVTLKSVCDVR